MDGGSSSRQNRLTSARASASNGRTRRRRKPRGVDRLAREHEWADKPRWAPDGRTIYFLSRHNSPFFNLWGSRFDRARGKPVGEPFKVTHFDAPSLVISPEIAAAANGISARRAVLTMATVTGNIWMLENVDK